MPELTSSPQRSERQRTEWRIGWALMAPFLLFFVGMVVVPLLYSGWLSTFRLQMVGGQSFAGLTNYVRVIHDPSFWHGVKNVLLFLTIAVPIQISISLTLALLFDTGRVRGARYGRLGIFLPFAVPGVIATLMWGFIYGEQSGLITQCLKTLGLPTPNLLGPNWILHSIMNITSWEYIGYNMIIFYAALRTVSSDHCEAAKIDGAGQWRLAWSIKIPEIRGSILLVVIFSIIFSLQLFNEPNLLWPQAPTGIGSDFTPNLYAYNLAFKNQDINYAAAVAFVLAIFTVIPSAFVLKLFNKKEDER